MRDGILEWWVQRSGFSVQGSGLETFEHRTSNVEWKKMKKQTYEMIL